MTLRLRPMNLNTPPVFVRIPALKTVEAFQQRLADLGTHLPCAALPAHGQDSPLSRPISDRLIQGKAIGNRFAIHPMEGWDAGTDGRPTELVFRRWERFGESGAKLICGGEAMAVRPEGRANPRQLLIHDDALDGLRLLRRRLEQRHRERFGTTDDFVVGFQLTHSGRFCKPNAMDRFEPRVAFRHPILDRRFQVHDDSQVFTDEELDALTDDYVNAAKIAREAGADFVDIKHCHGYLLHELLGAHSRPGRYGGSFENRTCFLRTVVEKIRARGNPIDLAVRLSAFDFVPFKPDPERSTPGKPGPGVPEDYSACLPYRFGFGVNASQPVEYDLAEPLRFAELCSQLGIKILSLSAGSPYYNPHIQRPAAYPPSDGYQPAYDPLIDVARQIQVVREFKRKAPASLILVGSTYTYLQDYLPHVAHAVIEEGWADMIGLGRMVLSYPDLVADILGGGAISNRKICRTFSDCTTAPRKGLISGCYPLDSFYADREEAATLKALKRAK